MGACFSKNSTTAALPPNPQQLQVKSEVQQPHNTKNDQPVFKKEIFVIKHRISHEIDREDDQNALNPSATAADGGSQNAVVRSPSCTKEELDAILIQCGRLSRSNSTGAQNPSRKRRYSRSKRSFDLDLNNNANDDDIDGDADVDDDDDGGVNRHRHRHRHRQQEVRVSSPCSRRSSRERDPQLQRCTSGRRISISPSRRSESPFRNLNPAVPSGGSSNRPAKMVPVPATDKSNNVGAEHSVKRIHVKRNASPAKTNLHVFKDDPIQEQTQQQMEAHHFPCTRKSLAEIDNNAARSSQPGNTKTALSTSLENLIHHQNITRTRKLSRDLDTSTNPETKPDPSPPSYASLLLEDIHNFHRKNTNAATSPPTFSLPDCVTKACSIMEAVADLNSNTSFLFSEDRWRNPTPVKREITEEQDTRLAHRELEVRELRDYPKTGIGRGGRTNTVIN